MRVKPLPFLLVCAAVFMMSGCAALPPKASFQNPDFSSQVASGEYVSKVDQFYVVMDASSSMDEAYDGQFNKGYSKFIVEKDLLRLLNKSIPQFDMAGGLAAFGLHPRISEDLAIEVYSADPHSTDGFQEGLGQVKVPGGTTPMAVGIDMAAEALKGKEGASALIVIGDGDQTSYDAVASAKALKEEIGDDLCIYTISVGADEKGAQVLEGVAEAAGCGFATTADDLASTDGMAEFVTAVFLAEAPPAPAPKITWILSDVNFDFDKWDLRPDAKETLNRDLAILKENPQIKVEIQGHTDDIGTAEYNQMLSEKRAQSVMAYLVENGIDPARLTAKGYGEERPRFPNDSEENRARNRRVEMVPFE